MVRALDQFKLFHKNKTYFVDIALGQIRNIDNPHDFISFSSTESMLNALITYQRTGDGEVIRGELVP